MLYPKAGTRAVDVAAGVWRRLRTMEKRRGKAVDWKAATIAKRWVKP